MPKSCFAYNCINRFVKGNGISFHKLPFSNKEKLNKCVSSLHRKDFVPTTHSFIFSKHFTPDCFYENHMNDTFLQHKDKGGLIKPSQDVVAICSFVEKCILLELSMNQGKLSSGNIKEKLSLKVLKFSLGKSFFDTLLVHVLKSSFPENRIVSLTKAIVNEFLNIRFHHLIKIANIKLKDRNIRQNVLS